MNDENIENAPIEAVPIAPIDEPVVEIPQPIDTSAPESIISEPIQLVPAPPTPQAPQTQSLAQQDEHGFIKSLLIKAQAKIQFNSEIWDSILMTCRSSLSVDFLA